MAQDRNQKKSHTGRNATIAALVLAAMLGGRYGLGIGKGGGGGLLPETGSGTQSETAQAVQAEASSAPEVQQTEAPQAEESSQAEDDGVLAIGSGGNYALAAARALVENTALTAPEIAEKALHIAASICVYTNDNIIVEEV